MGWRAVHSGSSDTLYSLVVTDSSVTGALVGNLPAGLTTPSGIAFGDGRWLVVDDSGNELFRINPDDPSDTSGDFGEVGNLPAGLFAPRGIAFGDGRWLVVDNTGDELFRINPDDPSDTSGDFGEVGDLPTGLTSPGGIAYGDGRWLVVDNTGDELFRINPDDPSDTSGVFGLIGDLPAGLGSSHGITFGDGRWLVVDNDGDELWRINPDDPSDETGDFGLVGVLPTGFTTPVGIGYEPDLPDAEAPTLEIANVLTVDEDDTLDLTATATGAVADTVDYVWSIDQGGGTIAGNGLAAVYTPPSVTDDTNVVVRITATATGTGVVAVVGTTTSFDTEFFQVRHVLGPITVPTSVAITGGTVVNEGDTLALTLTPTGGDYDILNFAWSVVSGGGTLTDIQSVTDPAVTYNPPDVIVDTLVRIRCVVTARGNGVDHLAASSGTITATLDLTVRTDRVIDTDVIYLRAADSPAVPVGGGAVEDFLPPGWTRTPTNPTETAAVWSTARTRTYDAGAFTSATAWGVVTLADGRLLAFADAVTDGRHSIFVGLAARTQDVDGTFNILYQTPARGGTDAPIAGDFNINGTPLSRMGWVDGTDTFRLNHNSGNALNFATYFDVNTHLMVSIYDIVNGVVNEETFPVDPRHSGGTSWVNLLLTVATETLLGRIGTGDRYIVQMWSDPIPLELAGGATTGNPTAAAVLELGDPPGPLELAGDATSGAPTAAAVLSLVTPAFTALALAASATTGAPTASAGVDLTTSAATPVNVAGTATTGAPTASAVLDLPAFSGNVLNMAGAATTGDPTASAVLEIGDPPGALELAGTATTGAPTASAALDIPVVLLLPDYDTTSLVVVFAALIEAGDDGTSNIVYAEAPQWTAVGSLVDGDLVLDGSDNISRMYVSPGAAGGVPATSAVRIRFNDHPDPLNLGTYFAGIESTHRLELQTAPGGPVYSFDLAGRYGSSGDNWIFFGIDPGTVADAWLAIQDGDRFIMALVQSEPLEVAGSATTGDPTASAALTLDDPSITPVEPAGSATTGAPTASAALSLVTPAFTPVELAGAATAGLPTASAAVTLAAATATPVNVAGSATTGAPTAGVMLDLTPPAFTPLTLAGSAATGAATASAALDLPAPTTAAVELAGTATTGAPTASAVLTLAAATFTTVELAGAGVPTTGEPTAAARLNLVSTYDFEDAPAVSSLFEGVDVRENRRLLIQQWRETRLDDVVRARLTEAQTKVVEVLRYVEQAASVDTAEGVWLDHVGARLGLPRPYVPAMDLVWFGFDDAGVSFGMASLRSDLEALTVLAPLGDACYRDLLRARVVLINPDEYGSGSKPLMEAALEAGRLTGTVRDGQDRTATITLTGPPLPAFILPLWREVLTVPGGVAVTVNTP